MKRILFVIALLVAFVAPSFAQEPAPAAPAADAAAPAADAAAPAAAPAADAAAPAPALVKIEGKIVVVKGAEGAADTYTLKAEKEEVTLLDGDKLAEIKKIEKFEEKTFIVEGEKIKGADGKEGFMIKSFEEKKADAVAPAAAPATEEKK